MKPEMQEKCFQTATYLSQHDIFFTENANGHFCIEKASYWATKDKWYIPDTCESGYGLTTLLMRLGLI